MSPPRAPTTPERVHGAPRPGPVLPGPAAFVLLGVILLGAVLFGAVGEIPLPFDLPRVEIRNLYAGLACLLAGTVIWRADRGPERLLVAGVLAYPLLLALQLVRMPAGLLGVLAPANLASWRETWPGPLGDCTADLVSPAPPSWLPVSLDPVSTRVTLFLVAAGSLVFLASRALHRSHPGWRNRLLWILAIFATAEAAYGIGQWGAGTPHVLWQVKQAYRDCASGTLINRNHFAMMVYLGLGATLSLLSFLEGRHRGPGHEDPGRETFLRTSLAVMVGVQLAAILASKSRAGLAAALLVVLPFLPRLVLRGRGPSRAVVLLVLLLVAVPAVLLVGPDVMERLGQLPLEWESPSGRGAVLRASLAIVRTFPVLGTGGGTFAMVFSRWRTEGIQSRYTFAHDDYLQVLIEGGFLGLLAALLPVLLVGALLLAARRRARREGGAPEIPWPLVVALGALLLHEVVDFSLQIPSNALLVALAAPLVLPRRLGSPAAARPLRGVVAGIAFLLVPLAILHSVARWPGIAGVLPWPDLPEVHHARARALATGLRQIDRETLCRALHEATLAEGLRTIDAYQSVLWATLGARAALMEGIPSAERERLREEALREAERTVLLDPWNAWHRRRLMNVCLSLGALDRALDHAEVTARLRPALARRIVHQLLDMGVPPTLVAGVMARSWIPFRELLRALWREKDLETLRLVVPPDPEPSEVTCRAGGYVRLALRKLYGKEPDEFLEACLRLPVIRDDERAAGDVRIWLARTWYERGELDRVRQILPEIREGASRDYLEMDLARREGDWETVVRVARRMLDRYRHHPDPMFRARIRWRLGEAYAHLGHMRAALDQFRKVARIDPGYRQAEKIVRELERGVNRFRDR